MKETYIIFPPALVMCGTTKNFGTIKRDQGLCYIFLLHLFALSTGIP